ncbi:MAG: DUF2764 family protein, partial [Bacteroidales bacterium]|nr:DUF2764 family protein [Bacteroidales bacterium]
SYDNKNLFNLLLNEEAKINARGNFTKEKLLYFISIIKESVENDERIIIKEKDFPAYLVEFLKHYFSDQEKEKKPKVYLEDYLSVLYYKYALKCKNEFTAKWFQFNLNLKNTLIALSGRRYNIDVSESILGENQIAKALRTSTMRDFGLSEELDYLEELIKVDEITELTDREKKIDELRWRWMEEETITNYFTIERLFVFLIQIDIIERWNLLDKEKGNQIFRGIIDSLKNEVQIPKEFR